jgi:hypothetical protein
MKNQLTIILTTLFFLNSMAFAQEEESVRWNDADYQAYMQQMQKHMKTMQEQMQKIQQNTDSNERQRLMQEHWQSMQAGMRLMHGSETMPGCMMDQMIGQGHMMGQGYMMNQDKVMRHGQMMRNWWNTDDKVNKEPDRRMQIMGSCMGMQQQMMDQMMMHINPDANK